MLAARDIEVLSFIQEFGIADARQIHKLFFSNPDRGELAVRRRLHEMVELGGLRRKKDAKTGKYLYYTKESQSNTHLLITEFYLQLFFGPGRIRDFENNFSVGQIRPSAYVTYQYRDQVFLIFLEVHHADNPLNIEKYERLYQSGAWKLPAFPRIVVVSDHRRAIRSPLNVSVIPTNFHNWEQILN